ncbi:MAG: hypothetical protein GW949_03340 [Spirochaetales bacterium]|nr:hypothetical protein [Spirochaetales bacterium]
MINLIDPVDPELLSRYMTEESLVARFKDLSIHLFRPGEAEPVMNEIGRIREHEFRAVGAGRNFASDRDFRDTQYPGYSQLLSWDPIEKEIVAMYRFIPCGWAIDKGGIAALRTSDLFTFSDVFIDKVLHYSLELGRSVVNRRAKRAIQGLFSIWTGLGALVHEFPNIRYFFGNVSLYSSLPKEGICSILEFLEARRAPDTSLVSPKFPPSDLGLGDPIEYLEDLVRVAADGGWALPPILISYAKAHRGLTYYGVSEDHDFGGALEAAITVPIVGLEEKTLQRFIAPYASINPKRFLLPEGPDQ